MRANEFYESSQEDLDTARYDPNEDQLAQARLDDTRRPRLTLRAINRLKKIRSIKKLENLQKQDVLELMFSEPEGDAEGGDMSM